MFIVQQERKIKGKVGKFEDKKKKMKDANRKNVKI